jgi:circadian clock protein KaiB
LARLPGTATRVELVLYVSAVSPASARALANARRILERYRARDFVFSVCDLAGDPVAAERDQIAFTPTLCKHSPEPPLWIVGDLSHPEPLIELLDYYGVHRTHGHRKADHRNRRV